jgi:hypothetical protein
MMMVITQQSTERSAENMAYVRRLLRQKQPALSAALEWAVLLADCDLSKQKFQAHDH